MNSSRRNEQTSEKIEGELEAPPPATGWRSFPGFRLGARFRAAQSVGTKAVKNERPLAENSQFQSTYRGLVTLAALLLLLQSALTGHLPPLILLASLIATALITLARMIPVASTRDRPLTLTAPLVFAIAIWASPAAAALSAIVSCFLHARFGSMAGSSRSYSRFQGMQLALSAYISAALYETARLLLPLSPHASLGRNLFVNGGIPALALLAAATCAALVFVLANLAFTALAHYGSVQSQWTAPNARLRIGGLALVYGLGMLPIVLLTPLSASTGQMFALPVTVMLLLSAQVARLTMDLTFLRGQLATAEAMGRASIAETASEIDAAVLLQRFLTLANTLVASERALVWTMDQETGELEPTAALPNMGVFAGQKAIFGEGLIGHAAARIRPRLVADAGRDPRRGRREIASGAWLLYPMIVHERLLGVAQWIRPVSQPFTQEDIARLDTLMPQAAVALENVRIREAMHNLAATDGLTGLWNHRRTHELLKEEMSRSARYHRALSVLMMDVDSFKTFNDTYGHPQGDQLLRGIAAILRANVRTVDHVGRYGGEEFLIVLPETSKDDACRLAERIRSSVEEQAFLVINGQVIHRTISIGVASHPEDALNPSEIVHRADEALYRAKRSGKNCVIWA